MVPTISPNGGGVYAGSTININDIQTPNHILYTSDGSTPVDGKAAALAYLGPLTLNGDETLCAVAIVPGYYVSPPTSATFAVIDHFNVSAPVSTETVGVPFTVFGSSLPPTPATTRSLVTLGCLRTSKRSELPMVERHLGR